MSKFATSKGEDKWLADNSYAKQDVPIVYVDKKGVAKRAYPDLILYSELKRELVIVEYKHKNKLNGYTCFESASNMQERLRKDRYIVKNHNFIQHHAWSNSIHRIIAIKIWAQHWMRDTTVRMVVVNPDMQRQQAKALGGNLKLRRIFALANRHYIEMLTPSRFSLDYKHYKQHFIPERRLEMVNWSTEYIRKTIKEGKVPVNCL